MLLLFVTDCFEQAEQIIFYHNEEVRFIFNALIHHSIEHLLVFLFNYTVCTDI